MILEGGIGFSGGQRQALLLARLRILQPNILVLDEPTAAIDDIIEKQLIDHLKGWWGQHTLVIATHRWAVLESVDRIIIVDAPCDHVLRQSQLKATPIASAKS